MFYLILEIFDHFLFLCCFFFKQKTAYEMRISDWSSDVCSSDLIFGTPTGQYSPGASSRRRSITRASEGMAVTTRNGEVRYQAYDLLNKDLTPMVAQVHARSIEEFGDFHRHDGEEFVYVLDGELAFYSDSYTPAYLKAGDSIYFDSGMGQDRKCPRLNSSH